MKTGISTGTCSTVLRAYVPQWSRSVKTGISLVNPARPHRYLGQPQWSRSVKTGIRPLTSPETACDHATASMEPVGEDRNQDMDLNRGDVHPGLASMEPVGEDRNQDPGTGRGRSVGRDASMEPVGEDRNQSATGGRRDTMDAASMEPVGEDRNQRTVITALQMLAGVASMEPVGEDRNQLVTSPLTRHRFSRVPQWSRSVKTGISTSTACSRTSGRCSGCGLNGAGR